MIANFNAKILRNNLSYFQKAKKKAKNIDIFITWFDKATITYL